MRIRITEDHISTILGAMVVLIVAVLMFNYFKNIDTDTLRSDGKTEEIVIDGECVFPRKARSVEYYDTGNVKKVECED